MLRIVEDVFAAQEGFVTDAQIPLTDMQPGATYKGENSGLYGFGSNEPPRPLLDAALREASRVRPLDAAGSESPAGAIGLLSIGFSNAAQEFAEFISLAGRDPETSAAVKAVNGAQFHMGATEWAAMNGAGPPPGSPWHRVDDRLRERGLTAAQVQVAWLKVAPRRPAALGEFPEHAEHTKCDLARILTMLAERFPNVRLAYVSSRSYAGYAATALSPEPYAYEAAFAVRWLIRDQLEAGGGKAPLALWGPYLWADGARARKVDGLVWSREDFTADGSHPSASGARKVGRLLLRFMKTDPTARPWFVA